MFYTNYFFFRVARSSFLPYVSERCISLIFFFPLYIQLRKQELGVWKLSRIFPIFLVKDVVCHCICVEKYTFELIVFTVILDEKAKLKG